MLCYLSKPAMRSLAAALSYRTCSRCQSCYLAQPAASTDYRTYYTYPKQSFQLLPKKRGILCLTVPDLLCLYRSLVEDGHETADSKQHQSGSTTWILCSDCCDMCSKTTAFSFNRICSPGVSTFKTQEQTQHTKSDPDRTSFAVFFARNALSAMSKNPCTCSQSTYRAEGNCVPASRGTS